MEGLGASRIEYARKDNFVATGENGLLVRVGTFDDPGAAQPALTMWTASAPSWACFDSELPQIEGQPPPAA